MESAGKKTGQKLRGWNPQGKAEKKDGRCIKKRVDVVSYAKK